MTLHDALRGPRQRLGRHARDAAEPDPALPPPAPPEPAQSLSHRLSAALGAMPSAALGAMPFAALSA
ncbi:hypothetical protein, partial [Pandoraea nosoerga]|uniref:hypothetical protein n=1 Tax=Pandoraea nosoerga TaxID=2508296 RepID=UPI00197CDD24